MARTIESDLSPGSWDCIRTAGDTDPGETFALTVNGDEFEIDEAIAQVRTSRSRTADVVLDRTCGVSGNEVTVGAGDEIPDEQGAHWWDLQVSGTVGGGPFGPITVVGGVFRVLADVSNEEGS